MDNVRKNPSNISQVILFVSPLLCWQASRVADPHIPRDFTGPSRKAGQIVHSKVLLVVGDLIVPLRVPQMIQQLSPYVHIFFWSPSPRSISITNKQDENYLGVFLAYRCVTI